MPHMRTRQGMPRGKAMNHRPIIMSGESVRAILAGRKTHTRRVIKGRDVRVASGAVEHRVMRSDGDHMEAMQCRFRPGGLLWVKETWKCHCEGEISDQFPLGTCVKYQADCACVKPTRWDNDQGAWCEAHETERCWRSPLFMPLWASRLTLEIAAVRAERLQDITRSDAMNEGLREFIPSDDAREIFSGLWDTLNAKRGFPWASDPWVWVIEFRKVGAH